MKDENNQSQIWPIPKFRFEVDFGGNQYNIPFQEILGLDVENSEPEYTTVKMPGIVKYGNIIMKRGVFVNDIIFWNWHKKVVTNIIERRTVIIKLLDEKGNVSIQWQLINAWPTKITGSDNKSDGNEVAVDTLEIAHEKLIISNGGK
jgi:phage tail-like protein